MTTEEFCKLRNEMICAMDVETFKAFYKKMIKAGVFENGPMPADDVIEITMRKMACNITNIPKKVQMDAAEWLAKRGMSPDIY